MHGLLIAVLLSLPLIQLDSEHFGIPVTVNGSVRRVFAIDTGGGIDYLPPDLAARVLPVPENKSYYAVTMTGRVAELPLVRLQRYDIAPAIAVLHPRAMRWAAFDRFGVPPLLSLWTFVNHPATFDLDSYRLTFEDAASLRRIAREAKAVHLEIDRDRDIYLQAYVDVDFGNGQHGQCVLDTGSGTSFLDARYMPAFGLGPGRHMPPQRVEQPEGAHDEFSGSLPYIALSDAPGIREEHPQVSFVRHMTDDCILGNDFWAGKRFTFDLRNERLYVRSR